MQTGLSSRTVWVVDNEPVIVATLELILNGHGYHACGFVGFDAPLGAARTISPDILVADVSLPDMLGIELATRVAATNPGCKVLLLSAQAGTSETISDSIRNSGWRFELLSKPIHPKHLLEAMRNSSALTPALLD